MLLCSIRHQGCLSAQLLHKKANSWRPRVIAPSSVWPWTPQPCSRWVLGTRLLWFSWLDFGCHSLGVWVADDTVEHTLPLSSLLPKQSLDNPKAHYSLELHALHKHTSSALVLVSYLYFQKLSPSINRRPSTMKSRNCCSDALGIPWIAVRGGMGALDDPSYPGEEPARSFSCLTIKLSITHDTSDKFSASTQIRPSHVFSF